MIRIGRNVSSGNKPGVDRTEIVDLPDGVATQSRPVVNTIADKEEDTGSAAASRLSETKDDETRPVGSATVDVSYAPEVVSRTERLQI